jgi:uncharacterized membrane protein HdeD (DUF308 family)
MSIGSANGKPYLAYMLPSKKSTAWWLLLAAGVIFLVIGIFAFIDPLNSYLKLVKFTGIALLINGGILLTMAVQDTSFPQEQKWMQSESVLHLFFGLLFLFNPLLAFIALPYFIGSWILLVGIVKTIASLSLRHSVRSWVLIFLAGILFDLFGILLLFSPFPKADNITILIGTFGLIIGLLYIVDAFRYRRMEDTPGMML